MCIRDRPRTEYDWSRFTQHSEYPANDYYVEVSWVNLHSDPNAFPVGDENIGSVVYVDAADPDPESTIEDIVAGIDYIASFYD